MPSPEGPARAKQLHVQLQEHEHRRISVVAADEGRTVTDLFRDLFLPEIDKRYEAITGHKTASQKRQRGAP